MSTEKLRRLAYTAVAVAGVLGVGFILIKYAVPVSLPFLIAWAVAFLMRPPARFISSKTKIPERVTRPVLTVLSLLLLLAVLSLAVWLVSSELWEIISGFGEGEELRNFLSRIFDFGGAFESLAPGLGDKLSDILFELAKNILVGAWNIVSSIIESIPRAFLFTVITVISCIYFAIDLERVNALVINALPKRVGEWLLGFKSGFLSALLGFARCYALLFVSTFVLVLAGFLILGVPYAFLLSAVISFFDLFPIIGTGTFLIPFALFDFFIGNTRRAVGILLLFVIQTVIRQFLEPRILGKHLGVHPIVTLVIIFAGYSFFGFFGILLVPAVTAVIEVLFKKKDTPDVKEPGVTE